jgi:hypothetical protein
MTERATTSDAGFEALVAKRNQAEDWLADCIKVVRTFQALLEEGRVRDREELASLVHTLTVAHDSLLHELDHPRVILATTGTTSGGKSSVVNFICGAEIMPVAIQQMSAGVVLIDHDEQERAVRVLETEGASWTCGEWQGLDDSAIRSRVQMVAEAYNERREERDPPAFPVIEIRYPTRIGRDAKQFGLPPGLRWRILDLPGLNYVGDRQNTAAIARSREALCLVTYNAAEANPQLKEKLLDEIVNQVKSLGGSPARMLFIMNRIDEYRRLEKDEWQERQGRFVLETTAKIKARLREKLPEHTKATDAITVTRLSSLPALLSLQANSGHGSDADLAFLESRFGFLIGSDILDDLARRVEKWSPHDRRRVVERVREASYAQEFERALGEHVRAHLPAIVLPPLLDAWKGPAEKTVSFLHQIATAERLGSEEEFRQARDRLDEIRRNLKAFNEEATAGLRAPLPFLREESLDLDGFLAHLPKYDLDENALNQLKEWKSTLGGAINGLVDSLLKAGSARSKVKKAIAALDLLPLPLRADLAGSVDDLFDAEYQTVQGTTLDTRH